MSHRAPAESHRNRSASHSRLRRKIRRQRSRPHLYLERLEDRTMMTVQPLTLADPSLYGLSGLGTSSAPSISADGQLIAFASSADNLVPNDHDGLADAFVYNRTTGTVTLASVGPNGMAAGIDNNPLVISPDGRYVAFGTNSTILPGISGDQLYLRDLQTSTTTLLSVSADGTTGGNSSSFNPVFSADSDQVGFASNATNLVNGISEINLSYGNSDLFERNLTTGITTQVCVGLDGKTDAPITGKPSGGGLGEAANFSLSADGRYVAFESSASNLVSGWPKIT